MKRLLSMLLVIVLALAVFSPAALADSGMRQYSDSELRQLYEAVRQEMKSRGLKLQQDVTLREGKYIVGDDILPGTYTLNARRPPVTLTADCTLRWAISTAAATVPSAG